ncbi:MAG: DUF4127 family protein [Pleomorphochaeta sp.]
MKILYMPLDERPCNYKFPNMNLINNKDIELIKIPKNYMGNFKKSANIDKIYEWLENNLYKCDAAVISLEMLIYGGLIPSRIHKISSYILLNRLNNFAKLVEKVKETKHIDIYIFALIMRTPAYSSSEEEPNYYAEYGELIFKRAYLINKSETYSLSKNELEELHYANQKIPNYVIKDYESRRLINIDIIKNCLPLLKNNLIDYLVIPQDDSSKFGYGIKEKKEIFSNIKKENIENKVLTYPGADEVGSALICRSIVKNIINKPKISIFFDREEAMSLIPKYEGMELKKSIKHQIQVSNAIFTKEINEADIILFVHTREGEMQDSWKQEPYEYNDKNYLNLLNLNKPFIICDIAFANGSDLSFVNKIFDKKISNNLLSYAAWNTAGNTIGTAISSGIIQFLFGSEKSKEKLLFYRIADDYAYQSIVRKKYNNLLEGIAKNTYIHIDNNDLELRNKIKNDLMIELNNLYKKSPYEIEDIIFPWSRLFEVDIKIGENKDAKLL